MANAGSKHIFISYVREDSDRVDGLCKVLDAARIPYWRDRDSLGPGDAWKAIIRDAVRNGSLVFLACFSENSRAKDKSYMNEELRLAIDEFRMMPPGRTWLIPVRLDEGPVPEWDLGAGQTLNDLNFADLFGTGHIANAVRLVATVLRLVGEKQPDSATALAAVEQVASKQAVQSREKAMFFLDPVANPYAPGAGQQPPELAGREAELRQLDVALARLAAGRPARGLVLTGLRGVGKTVLLNAMRSQAMHAGWATGKIEARLDSPLRAPVATALHTAVREVGGRSQDRQATRRFLAVLKAFSSYPSPVGGLQLAIDIDAARGRADSGNLEVDLTELFTDAATMAADLGLGVALFIDEMQDVPTADLVALCGACHEISQTGRPLLVVGAGPPPLPGALSAARPYAERLFAYVEIDRLATDAAERALVAPAAREGAEFTTEALAALTALADGYPHFLQAYGKATWDAAVASPITAFDVEAGRPDADRELAVGFFGSRYGRATRAERTYMHAMAALGDGPVSTRAVAARLGRIPSGVSPIRDGLIRKGLAYATERGMIAFTAPHFAAFLRGQEDAA